MYRPFDERLWAELYARRWLSVPSEYWGGPGIRVEPQAEVSVVGVVQRRAGAIHEMPAEVLVDSVASATGFYDLLMLLLPDYERESLINQAAMRGIAAIFGYVESRLFILEREQELSTAIDALARWERLFQLDATGKTPDERRQAIRHKLWSLKNVIREADVLSLLKSHAGRAEVEIQRGAHGAYTFKIGCNRLGDGSAVDTDLRKTLNASYVWTVEYKKNAWADLSAHTWQKLSTHTWEDAREGVIT